MLLIKGGGVYSNPITSGSGSTFSTIIVGSSIVTNGSNNIYNNGSTTITSNGYNIFNDAPAGSIGVGDQTNVMPVSLNLGPLAYNGGTTLTMLPGVGSVAINAGSTDLSDAQNRPIVGVRDVGAAEYVCLLTGTHNQTICFGESIIVNGTTYNVNNLTGTEVFSNVGANSCDSTVTVNLTIENQIDVTTTTTNFVITSNHSSATATYQWINCADNLPITGETNATYTAAANGDYKVAITEGNCSDTSMCVQIAGVGIEELSDLGVSIFPNPNNGEFTISTTENNVTLTIYSVDGKVIVNDLKITEANQLINLGDIESGIYFVKVTNDINQKTIRLVVE